MSDDPGGDDAWRSRVRDTYIGVHARLWRAIVAWSGSVDVADEAVAEAFAQLLRRGDPASTMFGRRWTATAVTVGGETQDLHAAGGLVLDFASEPGGETGRFDVRCVPPIAGPIEGSTWHTEYVADFDCAPGPPDERPGWIGALLDDADRMGSVAVAVADERLTLWSAGAVFEFAESDSPKGLGGSTWRIDRAVDDEVDRTLLPPPDAEFVTLSFEGTGSPGLVAVSGGCNSSSANVALGGDRLDTDLLFTTQVLCSGPVGEQDQLFAKLLNLDPLVLLRGDRLVLSTSTGRIEATRLP